MSYYGSPYEFYPVHHRFPPADPYDLRDMPHPHDLHLADMPHPDDAWCYGPPPPGLPAMYPPHHASSAPHFPPYEPVPYDAPHSPIIIDRGMGGVALAAERPHLSSNLGNSFAIPKGTRNAMHRVTAVSDAGNNIVSVGKTRGPSTNNNSNNNSNTTVKTAAQSVGATTTATAPSSSLSTKTRVAAVAAGLRPINVKFEANRPPPAGLVTTSPIGRTPTSAATPCSPSTSTNGPPIPSPAWKRMFEAARVRAQGESGVAAPAVELASQVVNKRCMQPDSAGPARKFLVTVDSTILRRGVLSSRSNEGMTVALYLFQPARGTGGDLVTTETMLRNMKISVDDTQLLPASGMSNGVQINLLPALTPEKFEKKAVTITIEAKTEDFTQGLAMICLRRLDPQICSPKSARPNAPVRPPYPLIAPAAVPSKRSASTLSASPSIASPMELPFARENSAASCANKNNNNNNNNNGVKRSSSSTTAEPDTEVEVGDQIVSLTCPVALKRIVLPGKGRECKHVQCFDLETFTKLSRLSPKWKCCVCNDVIEKTDLTVSEPFLHYLAAYPDADRCMVRANGSHAPYVEAPSQKRRKLRNSGAGGAGAATMKRVEPAIVVVDLCDDEGEEPPRQQSLSDKVGCDDGEVQRENGTTGQSVEVEKIAQQQILPQLREEVQAQVRPQQQHQQQPLKAPAKLGADTQHQQQQLQMQLLQIPHQPYTAAATAARAGAGQQQQHNHQQQQQQQQQQSPHMMFWVDRRGDTEIATAAESHCDSGAHDDISRMTSEERAALIHRIFAEAAEAAAATTPTGPGDDVVNGINSSRGPKLRPDLAPQRFRENTYDCEDEVDDGRMRRIGGMCAARESPRQL
ncbi:hypothetical protein DFJ77DRAFT_171229 [Powellomyces hirtus]|nr:hypothetical protein DFJ77DRAFT_171229 [Powellomyces hirtus]